jgi:hypothetical protein
MNAAPICKCGKPCACYSPGNFSKGCLDCNAKHAAYLRANRAKLKKQRSGSKCDRLEAYGWHN